MCDRNEPSTSSGKTHGTHSRAIVEQLYSSESEDDQENEDDYEDISDNESAINEVDEEFYDSLDEEEDEDEPEENAEDEFEDQALVPKKKYTLKKWTREAVFKTQMDLSDYFERNSFWRKTTQYNTKFGVRQSYYCNLRSEEPGVRCQKKMYLLESMDGTFEIFVSEDQHSHGAGRAKYNPLQTFVKEKIEELYLQNFMPKDIWIKIKEDKTITAKNKPNPKQVKIELLFLFYKYFI